MLKKLEQTILDENLISAGDSVIVAVSGGPDSMALFHGLWQLRCKYNLNLVAAHLNHGFRGEEADQDADYVARMAAKMDVPFFLKKVNVPYWMGEWGLGPQEAARIIRYDFLREVAGNLKRAVIATAHHGDDQVETIMMRLIRGTGPEGLSGIPFKRLDGGIPVVRPLLTISRTEIEAYCTEYELHPRLDRSNLSGKYTRNRIRLELIPLLKRENPEITQNMIHLSSLMREENDFIESEAQYSLNGIIAEKKPNKIIIKQKDFQSFHLALQRRMIKLILSYLSGKSNQIQFKHIEDCRRLFENPSPSARLNLPGTILVRREYNRVVFSREKTSGLSHFQHLLPIPGCVFIPEIGRTVHCSRVQGESVMEESSSTRTILDPKMVHGQLFVRNRRPGDRLSIKGMSGSKKIKDLFIDEKIPKLHREQIPLLVDEEKVLWIPGIRESKACISPTAGKEVLVVELQ